ncbi:hypothetical protein GCM10009682_07850 [Luedemannella flava]|uniref:DUF5666 domain-containing protein n=2 Tax=Luedemannella flava TaxID=349316 RepID=A0ABN2LGU5_9ACTN
MKRTMGVVVLLGVLGLGLVGCGRLAADETAPASGADAVDTTLVSLESEALLAMGFDQADVDLVTAAVARGPATPTASPDGVKDKGGRDKGDVADRGHIMRLRLAFGKKALHGEVVVETKNGPKTLVAQRGEITAVTATTLTVKSADGYTSTWTFAEKYHFFQHRRLIAATELKVGMKIGVAGYKNGDTPMARAVIIPKA